MKRPTHPPEKPYTIKQVLDMMYQHFVVDKAPKSYHRGLHNDGSGSCLYAGTGCTIGCMVTVETAELFDNCGSIMSVLATFPSYYSNYFERPHLIFLSDCQRLHDSWRDNKGDFTEYMRAGIERLRKQYAEA